MILDANGEWLLIGAAYGGLLVVGARMLVIDRQRQSERAIVEQAERIAALERRVQVLEARAQGPRGQLSIIRGGKS
mgnify:CR=1 FL=1